MSLWRRIATKAPTKMQFVLFMVSIWNYVFGILMERSHGVR